MGKLAHKKKEQIWNEVALQVVWRRRRYLGDGETFIFEQL